MAALAVFLVSTYLAPILISEYNIAQSLAFRPGVYHWRYLDERIADGLQIAENSEGKPIFRKVYRDRDHMVRAEISPYLFATDGKSAAKPLKIKDLSTAQGNIRDLLVLTAYWFTPCDATAHKTVSSSATVCRLWDDETALTRMQITQASQLGDLPSWQEDYGTYEVDFYLWDDDLDSYWQFREQHRASSLVEQTR